VKTMMARTGLVVTLACVACGDGEGTNDGRQGGEIERVPVSENRFKPVELEETIDELVRDLEASRRPDNMSLGVVLKELNHFWRPVVVGANRALGELEIAGAVQGSAERGTDTEAATAEQLEFVTEQRELDYSGLGIAPFGEALAQPIDEIVAEGKPVVTIDTDLPASDRQLYVGTDNTRGGETAGQTLVDLLDGQTGRVIILGNTDETWADGFSRTNAAADVIRSAGNEVQILHSIWDPAQEIAQAQAAIEAENATPIVGLLGVFANAHALATGAQQAGLTTMPKIVAFDFDPATLSFMQEGVIHATHVQRQYYMGYISLYLLYSINTVGLDATKAAMSDHLLRGFHIDTGLDVIRTEDLAEYNAFVDELGID